MELHDYQEYAVKFIKEHETAALLLDMGLGKTITTLTAINDLMYDSFEVQKVLIIAPLRVARDTWPAEIEKWEHLQLTYSVAVGTEEERIKALKARSNYVGTVGEKLTATVTWEGSPYFERRAFSGYGTERVYIHRFRDADGNLIIWKSCSGFPVVGASEGETFVVTGTVKEHSEYKDEKQTFILRAKVKYPA